MVWGPGLARGLLVSAENQNGDVRLLRDLNRFLDTLGIARRISEYDFVGVPIGKGLGDLAAQGIEHLGIRSHLVLDSLKHAHTASRIIAVASQVQVRGIGANYGDALVFRFVQRQKIAFILQQNNRFVSGFERQSLMLRTVCDLFRVSWINVGIVEESGQKLFAQHVLGGPIDGGFGDAALFHLFDQVAKSVGARKLNIHARIKRHLRRVIIRGGNMMKGTKIGNREVVGDEYAIESPFVAENVGEQVPVAVRRDAVNLVVGGHHALRVCLFYARFERLQEIFANYPFRIVAGTDIGAAFRLAVNGEVFESRQHVRLVDEGSAALKSFHRGDSDS